MGAGEQITGPQMAILRSLWRRGEASVAQVHEDVGPEKGYQRSTTATLLRRLEKRGLVAHRVEGREFHYRAKVQEPALRRSMVSELTERVFRGNVPQLVAELLSSRDVSAGDLAEVRMLIEMHERRSGQPRSATDPPETPT